MLPNGTPGPVALSTTEAVENHASDGAAALHPDASLRAQSSGSRSQLPCDDTVKSGQQGVE